MLLTPVSQCDWDGLAQLWSIMARGSGLSLAWFMSDCSLFSPLLTWSQSLKHLNWFKKCCFWISVQMLWFQNSFGILCAGSKNACFLSLTLWITMCCKCLSHIDLIHFKLKLPLHLYYKESVLEFGFFFRLPVIHIFSKHKIFADLYVF